MTINKRTTATLLDLLQRTASQLEGDYGPEDGLASELRDMHRQILGSNIRSQKRMLTSEEMLAQEAKREKIRHQAKLKARNRNGSFVKMP